jgi:SP family general alpha glucoside:H+ symporter-like MFS transporter
MAYQASSRAPQQSGKSQIPEKWLERSNNEDAQAANLDEHASTVREALVNYRWAVVWSVTISMSVIMEGETQT